MRLSALLFSRRISLRWGAGILSFLLVATLAQADAKSEWASISDLGGKLDAEINSLNSFRGSSREKQERLSDYASKLLLYSGWLDGFIARYPDDKNHTEARAHRLLVTVQLKDSANRDFDRDTWAAELDSLRQTENLSESAHAMVESVWIGQGIKQAVMRGMTLSQLNAFADSTLAFAKRHPRDGRSASLAVTVGELAQAHSEAKAEALFEQAIKLTKRRNPKLENRAEQALAVLPFRHRPIDLNFKAADGTKVDFKALQGKVVIVDFWASWCPPCRDEAPALAALYRRYREQGLVVVGVSLDESRKKMEAFAQQSGMEWPHYFDGRGWDNKLTRKYSIASIPTVWVIDRDGLMVDHDARGKLEQLVPQLLGKAQTVAAAR